MLGIPVARLPNVPLAAATGLYLRRRMGASEGAVDFCFESVNKPLRNFASMLL
ncbi:MAG: hypothetical protein KDJ80_10685 [Nitratireductor sp.]|nr:hypothetical protein [Nitratireductor sp.]